MCAVKMYLFCCIEESVDVPVQFEAQKDSRMTFHPVYELPMMRKWFQQNRNPTEEVL